MNRKKNSFLHPAGPARQAKQSRHLGSALLQSGYRAADADIDGLVAALPEDAPSGTTELPLVPGVWVVTIGAVLAGAVGIAVSSTFLPQAPNASNADNATTVGNWRGFSEKERIKVPVKSSFLAVKHDLQRCMGCS